MSGGEARDIARQLPPPLDEWLQPEHENAQLPREYTALLDESD